MDAERGTEIHIFCRSVIAGMPRVIALAALTKAEWRETCEQIDFGILCGGILRVRAEVSYRINIETDEATELGINLHRRYPVRAPHEVDGTNDFEGFLPSGMPTVTDIKTGFLHVTACRDNPQMKFHARALMLRLDVDKVLARVAYIDVGGVIRFDEHVFTRLELDIFNDSLLALRGRIERAREKLRVFGTVEVNANEKWCRYCPARISCPKFTSLARAMLPALRDVHARWGALTMAEKGVAYLMAAEAKDLSERILDSMKGLARTEPIALPGGKELRETSSGVRAVTVEKPRRLRRGAA